MMRKPHGDIDVLAIGETVVDLISQEETDSLLDAYTFRKHAGGAPANLATNVSRLGGRSAVISKIGAGPFGQFLKAELAEVLELVKELKTGKGKPKAGKKEMKGTA